MGPSSAFLPLWDNGWLIQVLPVRQDAFAILECVAAEARRRPDTQVVAVGVRIGELSNVDKDALDFAFAALTCDTPLAHLNLEVEWCPRRQKSLACAEEFPVHDFKLACPKCSTSP